MCSLGSGQDVSVLYDIDAMGTSVFVVNLSKAVNDEANMHLNAIL